MSALFLSGVVLLTAVAVVYVPGIFDRRLPVVESGFCADGWQNVCDTFSDHLQTGLEKGGGFAVYHQGKLVVEIVGGYADHESELPWEVSTLSQYYSTTKGVAAVVMALLVDRGLLEYNRPISDYWLDFQENGKENITVEHLLSHQAGLPAIDEPFSLLDIKNKIEKIDKILAAQKPHWALGEGVGYHGVTRGLYEDRLVRMVDPQHRSLSQFFQEEIAKPLDIDFYVGLPLHENYRCARGHGFPIFSLDTLTSTKYFPSMLAALTDSSSLISKVLENPEEFQLEREGVFNNPYIRSVPSPSTNGFGTVKSLAKLYGILSNGGVYKTSDGREKTLLSADAIRSISDVVVSGYDKVLLMNMTYGRGTTIFKAPHGGDIFGAPGAGGQMAFCDVKTKLGWSYLTNYQSVHAIGDDPKYIKLMNAMYKTVLKLK